jgi:hypothetical protein
MAALQFHIVCTAKAFHDRTDYYVFVRQNGGSGPTMGFKSREPLSIWRDGTRDQFCPRIHTGFFVGDFESCYAQLRFLDPAEDRSACQPLAAKHSCDPKSTWSRWGYTIKSVDECCDLPRNKEDLTLERPGMPGHVFNVLVEIVETEEPQPKLWLAKVK